MDLEFYGLTPPPFGITPNPRFLFLSDKHREALNHLLHGIRERKGCVPLTGEVGAGKTTVPCHPRTRRENSPVSLTNKALERMKEISTNTLALEGPDGSRQKLFLPGR